MKTFADTAGKVLTRDQLKAIEATGKWVGVIASAGSGKTTVLINRCLNILQGNPANLDHLLAITFTEKAAAELLARLRKSLPPKSHHLLATAWVGTFHAFCARILRTNAPLVGLDPSFMILDENAFRLLAQEALHDSFVSLLDKRDEHALILVEELEFKNAIALLQELIEFRWHAARSFKKASKATGAEQKLDCAIKHCYAAVESATLAKMKRQGAIDFQELEIKTLELLNNHASVRAAYQRKFKHILVDEYQDTSDIQSELVFLLANPKVNRLAIVGDPRQSIYRFRGANVRCFDFAIERIKETGGEIIALQENFRSEPSIITFTNSTFENLWDKIGARPPPMKSKRDDVKGGPAVAAVTFEGSENKETSPVLRQKEAAGLASYIRSLVEEKKFKFSDIACLFQAMTNIAEYEAAFKRAQVPYRIYGGRGLLERQEINDLMHALIYAADQGNDVALVGMLRSPLIGLSDDDLALMAGPDGKELRKSIQTDERTELLSFLKNAAKHMRTSEILKVTIEMTDYETICQALDPSGGMQANLERLIALAESLELEGPASLSSFIEFISELRARSARLGDPPALGFGGDAVSCMTVHTAKGLEFPVVVIPDLIRQSPNRQGAWRFLRQEGVGFKLKDPEKPFGDRIETERFTQLTKIDDLEEMEETKRLLYVAMTRARDLLVLPMHKNGKTQGKWHQWVTSTIENANNEDVVAIWRRAEGVGGRNIPLLCKEGSGEVDHDLPHLSSPYKGEVNRFFSVSELETYERCPQEYYLKYTLRLPANDLFKEESGKLAANVRGSIVHAVIQRYDPSKDMAVSDLIKAECINASVYPDKKIMNDMEKLLSTFAGSKLAKDIGQGKREVRFDWMFGGATVTGFIDWLKPANGGFDIVDFKTDAIRPEEVGGRAREYDLQLVTYALAASDASGRPIRQTSLYFLEPDVVHTEAMDEKRAKEGKARIEKIIGHIEKNEFELGIKSPPCYKCPYSRNRMCSAATI